MATTCRSRCCATRDTSGWRQYIHDDRRRRERGKVVDAPCQRIFLCNDCNTLYPDSLKSRDKFLAFFELTDSVAGMIQSGLLSEEDRKALTALARDGSSLCRVSRRANALVLLDKGG